jgi:folate-dependent phosphoribosylglycinamide formyltransferase PurN
MAGNNLSATSNIPGNNMNIGILTDESLSDFRLQTLKPILEDRSFLIKLAIIDTRPKKSLKQKLLKNLKRGRGGYMLVMACNRLFTKKEKTIPIRHFCQQQKIAYVETSTPYASDTLTLIRDYQLDVLLLLGGFGLVKAPLIQSTRLGILSYHHGDMRKYRGMPPALWELYNNEPEMGITVQLLAPGLDCGIPIEEKTVGIKGDDNLKKLRTRALAESNGMLHQALLKLARPTFRPTTIEHFGQVYTLPNLKQWIRLQLSLGWRKLKYAGSSQVPDT